MFHHFGAALPSDIVAAKFILEPGIDTFSDTTLVVTNCVGWF